MKIGVLGGGGAMGGIIGGSLQLAGHEVTLIDVSTAAVEAINTHGLRIEEKDGSDRIVRIRASRTPQDAGPVDVILNFVKCYHTEAAVRAAAPMVGAATVFLTLQNGWGNAPRIAGVIGEGPLIVGLTYHSGTLVAPGHVKHPGLGMTFLGEIKGGDSPLDVFNHPYAYAASRGIATEPPVVV